MQTIVASCEKCNFKSILTYTFLQELFQLKPVFDSVWTVTWGGDGRVVPGPGAAVHLPVVHAVVVHSVRQRHLAVEQQTVFAYLRRRGKKI